MSVVRFRRVADVQVPACAAGCMRCGAVAELGIECMPGRWCVVIGYVDHPVQSQPVKAVTETRKNVPCGPSHGSRIVCHATVILESIANALLTRHSAESVRWKNRCPLNRGSGW